MSKPKMFKAINAALTELESDETNKKGTALGYVHRAHKTIAKAALQFAADQVMQTHTLVKMEQENPLGVIYSVSGPDYQIQIMVTK